METKEERLKAIFDELDELHRLDSSVSKPRMLNSNAPVEVVPLEVVLEYGKRADRRAELHEELKKLALENWKG